MKTRLHTTPEMIFNELIAAIENSSTDNTATITNVKLWADSWRKEMEMRSTGSHPDNEADGIVFCGKCGKSK